MSAKPPGTIPLFSRNLRAVHSLLMRFPLILREKERKLGKDSRASSYTTYTLIDLS